MSKEILIEELKREIREDPRLTEKQKTEQLEQLQEAIRIVESGEVPDTAMKKTLPSFPRTHIAKRKTCIKPTVGTIMARIQSREFPKTDNFSAYMDLDVSPEK